MQAVLALADGSIYRGKGFGAIGLAVGELCFNTAMSGYQEILSDPSYRGQIVTLTYPHIGNTGVNPEDMEGARIHCSALVVRNLPRPPAVGAALKLCMLSCRHIRLPALPRSTPAP